MPIEDMRIGGYYVLNGCIVQCVALSLEMGRSERVQAAAYRSDDDRFMWCPVSSYRPVERIDIVHDIRARYT